MPIQIHSAVPAVAALRFRLSPRCGSGCRRAAVPAVAALRFENFCNRNPAVHLTKATCIEAEGRGFVMLGGDGIIYTDRVRHGVYYGPNYDHRQLMLGLARLGVITNADASAHVKVARALNDRAHMTANRARFIQAAVELRVELTKRQLKQLDKL